MADPALLLGAAVVKTACKIWLKDNAIAANAAVSILDIIQAKVADVREQRRVRRLFEDLEERVADNLASSLGTEFRNVPDNERQAAVLAVRDTFERAKLTSSMVFAADLTVGALEGLVRPAGQTFTASLSTDATVLYDRVLYDCCAYVVEVANVLPGFQIGVFREILSRQHDIMRRLDERFDLLPIQLGGRGAETFEPTYRRLVAKQLDKVELFGVTMSERIGNYPLSVAYVSLSIHTSSMAPRFGTPYESMEIARRSVASIDDALGATKRAFIRGEAGSGKTTLLQWLAVRAGRREFTGPLADWNECVPLFIRLRRYSGADLPAPEEFLREVGRTVAHTMPLGWVHHLLASGRALVLVDGVDELPEVQRRHARDWLRELVEAYPDARYVVTSRPAAAAESWLDGESFEAFEIQPMTVSDIDAFVRHWHAAMAAGISDAAEVDRIESSRDALTAAITARRHLRMLAVSPLMTALICALHLDRRMQLPDDRMELYSIALEMLLERRDAEREIRASDLVIPRTDKMLILEDLAYWLVRNGWSDASRQRVLARLADKLKAMHRVRGDAEEVLTHLLDRSGLLRSPVEGQIDFVHKTFQEFLAARAAVANDDIGVLVQHAHDDQWREVVLMAAGHARPQQTDELLRKLLERADQAPEKQRYVLHALAVGAIQHAPQLSLDLRERLNAVAARLLPPRGMTEAAALAGAGELALELLSGRTRYTTAEAAATIRMAATIGGEQAMSIIATCGQQRGRAVRDELERAWSKFEPEVFAERVLTKQPQLYLRVGDPSQLPALKHLRLTTVDCQFSQGHGNVDYLDDLPELEYFVLRDPLLRDLSAAARHPKLEYLTIRRGTGPVNVTPLGSCRSLRRLDIALSAVEDRRQLGGIAQIHTLQLTDSAQPQDVLPFLPQGQRLQRIGFWEAVATGGLDDLLAAPQLADLDFLLLGDADHLTSIAGIEQWADTMTGVYLEARRLRDVTLLARLPKLTFANLKGARVTSLEFTRDLPALERLHVGGATDVPDLTPLRELQSLRYLHIWGRDPVDLSGLAGASDLEVFVDGGRRRRVTGMGELAPSVVVRNRGLPRRRS
ncbi:MAG: NACHT domain-containing protein [Actinomycetota bacterium]|nr:NACHT domain-containing protein [Actinomycetota bacterium]